MNHDDKFEAFMAEVYDAMCSGEDDPAEHAKRRWEFAFHMTDWASDLEQMAALREGIDRADPEKMASFVYGFLAHVVPHLNSAARLMLGEVPDPFAELEGRMPSVSSSSKPDIVAAIR